MIRVRSAVLVLVKLVLAFAIDVNNGGRLIWEGDNNTYIHHPAEDTLAIFNAGGTTATFGSNRTLYIGTTTPTTSITSKLVINGDISFAGTTRALMGNLYYDTNWKYIENGYGWGIRAASNVLQFLRAGNNTSGAGAAATVSTSDLITFDLENNNIGVGTSTPSYKLEVNGSFAATTKSFVIDHPTKPGMKLRYGSLESPYHGVRLTGSSTVVHGECVIELPEYIHALCKQEGSTVHLTNIKHGKVLWVEEIDIPNNRFIVKTEETNGEYRFYWDFTAIRKDIEDMTVEF